MVRFFFVISSIRPTKSFESFKQRRRRRRRKFKSCSIIIKTTTKTFKKQFFCVFGSFSTEWILVWNKNNNNIDGGPAAAVALRCDKSTHTKTVSELQYVAFFTSFGAGLGFVKYFFPINFGFV